MGVLFINERACGLCYFFFSNCRFLFPSFSWTAVHNFLFRSNTNRIELAWMSKSMCILMSSHIHQHFLEHPLKTGAFSFGSSFAIFYFSFRFLLLLLLCLEKLVNYCKQATKKKFNAFWICSLKKKRLFKVSCNSLFCYSRFLIIIFVLCLSHYAFVVVVVLCK